MIRQAISCHSPKLTMDQEAVAIFMHDDYDFRLCHGSLRVRMVVTTCQCSQCRLITTSRQPRRLLTPRGGEVDRLGLAAGRFGQGDQTLGFEIGEAMGEVALVV